MKKLILLIIILLVATSAFASMEESHYRLGVISVPTAPRTIGTATTFGIRFPVLYADLGIIGGQNSVGLNTIDGGVLRVEFGLPKAGDLNSHLGFTLLNKAGTNTTNNFMSFNVFVGFEYEIIRNFSLLADVSLLEVNSFSSTAATAGTIYCGARAYF
ncbi:MAG: hypothetical protein ABIH50_02540 [bacterium]